MSRITKGKAVLQHCELRCRTPRSHEPYQFCNKLIALKNEAGQLAGAFKCVRCHQDVHVESTAEPQINPDVYAALVELWQAQKELGDSPLGYVQRYPDAVQRLTRLEKDGINISPSK
jgi:hypothetical protein